MLLCVIHLLVWFLPVVLVVPTPRLFCLLFCLPRLISQSQPFNANLHISVAYGPDIISVSFNRAVLLSASSLSLAGAGGPAVGGGGCAVLFASGEGSLAAAESPLDLLGSGEGLVLHFDQSAGSAATALLDGLLVGGDVESDEQNEVAGQDAHASESSELFAGALAGGRKPGEVAGGEVGVGGEVDEAQVDDELGDLQDCDVFLPPDADAARGLEVVPVHDDVDGEVESDDDPGDGGVAEQLGVAEQGGGSVVVGVEEGERLLLEDEEDGVNEFEVLGQVVELGKQC